MNLLKGTTVFIGWLSGALAGIGALLYSCGYLVTRAHLRLLGIDQLLVSSNERFIQQGGMFFAATGEILLGKLFDFVMAGLTLAVVPVGLYVVLALVRRRWLTRLRQGRRAVLQTLARWHRYVPWRAHLSFYLLLLILLLVLVLPFRNQFAPPMKISDLLYEDPEKKLSANPEKSPATDKPEDQVRCWLLKGQDANLQTRYSVLVERELEAMVLVALAWSAVRRRVHCAVMLAPFVAVLAIFTVYLPLTYGVLMLPTSYNQVALTAAQEHATSRLEGSLFLLQKANEEYVVWDRGGRTVQILPQKAWVAEVREVASLFQRKGPCG